MKTYLSEELFSDIAGDPGNVLLTFPEDIINSTGWKEGDTLNIEVVDGCLHITKIESAGGA
jgi:hypothetical protein